MPDWSKAMTQSFEYYQVDPNTWFDERPITTIIDSSLERDLEAETLGSASFSTSELLGECYIRVYLITIQNGNKERFPLGTYLVQTPSYSYDGRNRNTSLDAYTPLIELKENPPPIGYFIPKERNVMDVVYEHTRQYVRCPVVKATNEEKTAYDFVSNTSDTWLTYINDLVRSVNYYINLDDLGRIIFEPKPLPNSLAPSWVFTDNNSSILYPAITIDNDLYGIPNVIEVIYSTDEYYFTARVENREDSSPISIENRGREILHRVTNPEISGIPSDVKIRRYAENLLKEMSSIEYTITYTHGYCPVRLGDCVILDYKKAGINKVKARVIRQNISCVPGTPVEETAVFTNNLWR